MGDVVSLEEYRKRRLGEQGRQVAAESAASKLAKRPLKQPAEQEPEVADDPPKS
jgi:hypothetical protein